MVASAGSVMETCSEMGFDLLAELHLALDGNVDEFDAGLAEAVAVFFGEAGSGGAVEA